MHDQYYRNNPKGVRYQDSNIPNLFIIDWVNAVEVDSMKEYYNEPMYLEFIEIDTISDIKYDMRSTDWLIEFYRNFYNSFKKEKYWIADSGRPNPFNLNLMYDNVYVIRILEDRYERVKVRQIEQLK